MTEPLKATPLTADPSVHWGNRLRLARENRGWPIEQVAMLLKLKPAQVLAMESEDVANVCHDPLFAKAYFRNYLRLLSLPESVLDEIPFTTAAQPNSKLHTINQAAMDMRKSPPRKGLSSFWRWLIGLLLLSVLSWQFLANARLAYMGS
jgi:cytoskeletal protein RodZ